MAESSALAKRSATKSLIDVFVQIGPDPHYPGRVLWHDLQVQQQLIADAEPPGIDMVKTSDLKYLSNVPFYLDQQSQIILGARRSPHPLSFHSLRHTATSLMHEAGVPAAVVQAMIGHDSETMHQHYIGVGQEAMKAAANALPQVTPN